MKKAWICAVLACLLSVFSSAAWAMQSAVVNNPDSTDRLNLRAAARETAVSLGKYYNGVEVAVYGIQNGWAEVEIYGRHGYVKDTYLAYGTQASQVQSAIPTVTVASSTLNLRADTTQRSTSLGTYGKGTQVEVLGVGTDWHHVRIGSAVGYMMSAYLSGDLSFHKVTATGTQDGIVYAVVNNPNPADRLNLRTRASTEADSLCKFYSGTQVQVLEQRSDGWCRVCIGSGKCTMTGYMRTAYLAFGSAGDKVASAVKTRRVAAGVRSAVVERTKGSTSNALMTLTAGDTVKVLGDIGTQYCFVQVGGVTGYLLSGYLE